MTVRYQVHVDCDGAGCHVWRATPVLPGAPTAADEVEALAFVATAGWTRKHVNWRAGDYCPDCTAFLSNIPNLPPPAPAPASFDPQAADPITLDPSALDAATDAVAATAGWDWEASPEDGVSYSGRDASTDVARESVVAYIEALPAHAGFLADATTLAAQPKDEG